MARSMKNRLDVVYKEVIDPTVCPTCGIRKTMPMVIYVNCTTDPSDTVMVAYPCDYPRCPTCGKPPKYVIFESEERVKIKLAHDQAIHAKSIQDGLSGIPTGNLGGEVMDEPDLYR